MRGQTSGPDVGAEICTQIATLRRIYFIKVIFWIVSGVVVSFRLLHNILVWLYSYNLTHKVRLKRIYPLNKAVF